MNKMANGKWRFREKGEIPLLQFRTYWWREIGWLGEALSPLENGN